MLAGTDASPRSEAIEALQKELEGNRDYYVRFVLAGARPQVISAAGEMKLSDVLTEWRCTAPIADLPPAIRRATELGGGRARILVLTDHAPPKPVDQKRLQWWSFGSPQPNVAITAAARSRFEDRDRCFFEIANISSSAARTTLTVKTDRSPEPVHTSELTLEPFQQRRVRITTEESDLAVHAQLTPDGLAADDSVVLLPERQRKVRVSVQISDPELRLMVTRALEASGMALLNRGSPQIRITDDGVGAAAGVDVWSVQIVGDENAKAYLGPFVIDRTHALTEGVVLTGVVWGAGTDEQLGGRPVIAAGNMPLLADTQHPGGRHTVRLRLRPEFSTLMESPDWPILWWNLLNWRSDHAPGLRRANVRLGERVALRLSSETDDFELTDPTGRSQEILAPGKTAVIEAGEIGVYTAVIGDQRYAFASNALHKNESDLTGCASGKWGDWTEDVSHYQRHRSIAWVLLLLALVVQTFHLALIAGSDGRWSGQ
jgi:hypothetical protein